MKIFGFLALLSLLAACDPYGFGFPKNPAYVLDESFKSITNLDVDSFLEVTGKEALCLYGNEQGLHYLKEKINLDPSNVTLVPNVLETKHYPTPVFVGYWSYYNERYQVQIRNKQTSEVLMETIVDCDYGIDGEKNPELVNQKPKKYKKKECRAIKLIPKTFESLPVPEKCEKLRVNL